MVTSWIQNWLEKEGRKKSKDLSKQYEVKIDVNDVTILYLPFREAEMSGTSQSQDRFLMSLLFSRKF
jgi:hypothetical protein